MIAEPGCGPGRQVLEAILETAFGELSAYRLWLVFEDNSRARHLYRSAGFGEEGTLRECVRYGAEYRSLAVMSMLAREYVSPRRRHGR